MCWWYLKIYKQGDIANVGQQSHPCPLFTNCKIISETLSEALKWDGVIFAVKTFMESGHDPDKHSESNLGHVLADIGLPFSSSAQSIAVMWQHSAGLHDKQCTDNTQWDYMIASAQSIAVKRQQTVGLHDSQYPEYRLHETTDSGLTWQLVPRVSLQETTDSGLTWQRVPRVSLQETTDSGLTWQPVPRVSLSWDNKQCAYMTASAQSIAVMRQQTVGLHESQCP